MIPPVAERVTRFGPLETHAPEVSSNGQKPLENSTILLTLAQNAQLPHEEVLFEPYPEPHVLLPDAFNAAKFTVPGKGEFAIARRLTMPSPQPHGIDYNRLVVFKIKDGVASELHELEIPSPQDFPIENWEDPRVIVTKEGEIIIGLTAIGKRPEYSKAGPMIFVSEEIGTITGLPKEQFQIHPALVRAHVDETGKKLVVDGEPLIFPQLLAKNITPISHKDGKTTFLCRLDDDQHTHTLSVMEAEGQTTSDARLTVLGEIQVPKKPWNDARIGTAGTELIVLPNGDVWLPIHYQQNAGEDRVIYRLGLLRQKTNGEVDVSRPIFEREDFEDIVSREIELHPNGKVVIYSVSHERRNGGVSWTVTAGDKVTVDGAYKSIEELQEYFPQN